MNILSKFIRHSAVDDARYEAAKKNAMQAADEANAAVNELLLRVVPKKEGAASSCDRKRRKEDQ